MDETPKPTTFNGRTVNPGNALIVLRNRYTGDVRTASRITPYLIRQGWHVDEPLTKHYGKGKAIVSETHTSTEESTATYGD